MAASVTPLRDNGNTLDDAAFPRLCEFFRKNGVDGIFALGTTGEGILLSFAERKRVAELFVANAESLKVAIHCGALSTRETAALCEHAASIGAASAFVMAPPGIALDQSSLLAHFSAAARACAPLPFYLYEFAGRVGYSLPLSVISQLREIAPNLRGLKVSTTPWEKFQPFMIPGLEILAGPEAFIAPALAAGANGAISGLASGFPDVVAAHVKNPNAADSARITQLRTSLNALPFNSAIKAVLARRGVPIAPDVRAPLRTLAPAEWDQLDGILNEWNASSSPARAR
jgi:dihydrodipicolinate synthase/N-acetylneuraminate lyase